MSCYMHYRERSTNIHFLFNNDFFGNIILINNSKSKRGNIGLNTIVDFKWIIIRLIKDSIEQH